MYTKMLGYDVEFGHKQAMDMMAATTYDHLELCTRDVHWI